MPSSGAFDIAAFPPQKVATTKLPQMREDEESGPGAKESLNQVDGGDLIEAPAQGNTSMVALAASEPEHEFCRIISAGQ
jgi:hypothetical protein